MWGNALTDSCGTATVAVTSKPRAVCSSHRGPPPITPTIPHPESRRGQDGRMAPHAKVGDQPVNVRLPRELHEAVLSRAEIEDRTMAQTIRVALRYYLEQTKPIVGA